MIPAFVWDPQCFDCPAVCQVHFALGFLLHGSRRSSVSGFSLDFSWKHELSHLKKGPWLVRLYKGLYYPIIWGL